MAATPRELVYQTLDFRRPLRAPRQMWHLPWAREKYPREFEAIVRDFPPDIEMADAMLREPPATSGDPFQPGEYVDEWGCRFQNIHPGVIGEVQTPLVNDWDEDGAGVKFPTGWLTMDREAVNRACAASDRFQIGGIVARPFERLQFLRTTQELFMDLADPPDGLLEFMGRLHEFYCELYRAWCRTDVDAIMFMDDWGSQDRLLVNPAMWREMFRPLYADYIDIAHGAGKRAFMHSDGHILAILPDLIEIGLDALNSQIFCMGADQMVSHAGRITFWGEIDRQYLLARGTTEEVADAVRSVHKHLWRDGGCIAQCEFGPGARPENVRAVFETWESLFAAPGVA
jgi:uroporphyrinogen decarboxylase